MKQLYVSLVLFLSFFTAISQDANEALAYMDEIEKCNEAPERYYRHYLKFAFRVNDSARIEKSFSEYKLAVEKSKTCFTETGDFLGDALLLDAYLKNVDTRLKLIETMPSSTIMTEATTFNEILNYTQGLRSNNEQMTIANRELDSMAVKFASQYNIDFTLDQSTSIRGEFLSYFNEIYNVRLKCNAYRNFFFNYLDKEDTEGMQLEIDSLKIAIEEAWEYYDLSSDFYGDNSMQLQLKKTITFYENDISNLEAFLNFITIQKEFDEYKKKYETLTNVTQEDIDKYNDYVQKFNDALQKYNEATNNTNTAKNKESNEWERAIAHFHRKHLNK